MDLEAKIYIAGHTGLVGRALQGRLETEGYANIVTRRHADLELCRQSAVGQFFAAEQPEYVFLAAARVGGINANSTYPAEFITTNLGIQVNVVAAAHTYGVKRLIFFGSNCAYPKAAPQPTREDHLLTAPLEPTSAPYAMAKLAGMQMCAAYNAQHGTRFLALIPPTVYGPHDNFDPLDSHVLPALIRRFREAKQRGDQTVTVWGTGSARREFLFADDLADVCWLLMRLPDAEFDNLLRAPLSALNVGGSEEIAIRDLAELIKDVVGYPGRIVFDSTRPDGAPRKLLDTSRLGRLGWRSKIALTEGIQRTYEWYQSVA